MRFVSFSVCGQERAGVVTGQGIVDATERLGIRSVIDLFSRRADAEKLTGCSPDYVSSDVTYLPAVPNPAHILCVGLNYQSHLIETGREPPKWPMIFTRFSTSQVGHQQPMLRPRVSEKFDFEGELAVIIGRPCRHVPVENAMSVIVGYSVYNDGSIRDWQKHTSQFAPGKNFPATGGFGPHIVTADEVADIRKSTLVTRLNGREMQRAVVDDLVFDIAQLVHYCSTFTPLSPGDVIVTGTTGGVGAARTPPLWLTPGDSVEVEISEVGTLVNPIGQE